MSKVKGSEKTGGRKKGTPNKSTKVFREYLDSINFNLPERIVELLPTLDNAKQVDVLLKLMDYTYPKFKSVLHQSEGKHVTSLIDWLHGVDEE